MSKSSKEQRPYKYSLVVVIWDDATALDDGWGETPETLGPSFAISAGFLVRENKDYILLASSFDENHTNGRFQIPKAIIKEIKEIK